MISAIDIPPLNFYSPPLLRTLRSRLITHPHKLSPVFLTHFFEYVFLVPQKLCDTHAVYAFEFAFKDSEQNERKCETGLVTDSGGQARKRRRLSRLGEIDTNAVLTKRAERDGKDKEGRMNWHGDRGDEGVSVMGVQG